MKNHSSFSCKYLEYVLFSVFGYSSEKNVVKQTMKKIIMIVSQALRRLGRDLKTGL